MLYETWIFGGINDGMVRIIRCRYFETVWATLMVQSWIYKVGILNCDNRHHGNCILLLARATVLPLSIAYPVWTGIGAVGSILVGVVLFKDALSPLTWDLLHY